MQTSNRMAWAGWLVGLLIVATSMFAQSSSPTPQAQASAEVAVVKGGAGPCAADFVVKDSSGKNVYGAKIEIQLRYGFMGVRRLDASVGTNFEGQARIEGLPDRIRGTVEFKISQGSQSKSVPYDPTADCHARHEVVLGDK